MAWHQQHPTGQLLSNANSDVEAAWAPIAPLPMAVGTLAMMVIAIVQMLFTDIVMAVVGLLVFPLVMVVNVVFQRLSSPIFTRIQALRAELSEIAHESFDGAMVVKTLGRESEETDRFAAKAHDLRDEGIRAGRIRAAFDPFLESLPNLGVLAVLGVGVCGSAGTADPGDVVTIAYLLTIVAFPIRSIGWMLGEFPRSVVGYQRVHRVLDTVSETTYGDGRLAPTDRGAALEVDDLGYTYEAGQVLLDGIDFTVEPGRTVAVVGATASGKSTLTSLVTRLVDPVAGAIRVDGDDLRDLAPGELAAARLAGAAERVPLRRHRARQRDPGCRRHRRGGLGRAAHGPGRRLRRRPAARPRQPAGRARHHPVRRPAPAALAGPRPGARPAAAGARRRHLGGRPRGGGADPGRRCASARGADSTMLADRLPQGDDRAGRRGAVPRRTVGSSTGAPTRSCSARNPGYATLVNAYEAEGVRRHDVNHAPRGADRTTAPSVDSGDEISRHGHDPARAALLARARCGLRLDDGARADRHGRPGRRPHRGAADPRQGHQRARAASTSSFVAPMAVLAALAILATGVSSYFMTARLFTASERGLATLRIKAFRHVHDLPLLTQNTERRGALVSRVTSDVDQVSQFLVFGGDLRHHQRRPGGAGDRGDALLLAGS